MNLTQPSYIEKFFHKTRRIYDYTKVWREVEPNIRDFSSEIVDRIRLKSRDDTVRQTVANCTRLMATAY